VFIKLLHTYIRPTSVHQYNLLVSEKEALMDLLSDETIVIKPADKGGSIVIQDRKAYVQEIERQLEDTNSYRLLMSDPTFRLNEEIKPVLKKALRETVIQEDEYKFLLQSHLHTCQRFGRETTVFYSSFPPSSRINFVMT
uniref:Uncharacterized protein n=2 Tax=Astyanax mexicanus TaxID=7994 RepID=A0A3B1KJ90_ASTMX